MSVNGVHTLLLPLLLRHSDGTLASNACEASSNSTNTVRPSHEACFCAPVRHTAMHQLLPMHGNARMSQLIVQIGDFTFDARFEEQDAPKTVAAFKKAMPFDSQAIHV